MKLMHRFLPLPVIAIALFLSLNLLPVKRFVVYKLGISGDTTTSCCQVSEILKSSGKFEESGNIAIFNSQIVDYPKTSLAQSQPLPSEETQVLGEDTARGKDRWIEVSIAQQRLRAWEGSKIVMEFPISSGRWFPTPLGDFNIWYKTRFQSMVGGSRELGTYYNLPNVPNNMFFYQGFAIHGAYWHNNFGQSMSHGCVNAPLAQAAALFEWTGPKLSPSQNIARATADNPGTRVYIH